ncbi:hypothetical protein [Haladaptatus caseinilyticus]|uniref:hypothetical protein n=1 Tax=Haladaptatus caseinilyticus TaxID=2993314 RepID=UPI00224A6241|nr:hypothetical protein [Haladaptatus caseinilyticus]
MTPHSVSSPVRNSDDDHHLYGAPQHEVTDPGDPDETLYGTPQHETDESLGDFELFRLGYATFDYREFTGGNQIDGEDVAAAASIHPHRAQS